MSRYGNMVMVRCGTQQFNIFSRHFHCTITKLKDVCALFIAFLLNNSEISVSTTSLIFMSNLTITQGKITVFKDFNFTSSPNFKGFSANSGGIFFSFSDKASRKQLSHFFPHTLVVDPESKMAELMVYPRKVELSSISWLSNSIFTISSQVLVTLFVW